MEMEKNEEGALVKWMNESMWSSIFSEINARFISFSYGHVKCYFPKKETAYCAYAEVYRENLCLFFKFVITNCVRFWTMDYGNWSRRLIRLDELVIELVCNTSVCCLVRQFKWGTILGGLATAGEKHNF